MIACDLLDIEPVHLTGHLAWFWSWALDNAPDGDISDISPRNIARASSWSGDAQLYFDALVEAGFIDVTDDDIYIHGWDEYGGKLVDQRTKEKERSRKRRASDGRPRTDTEATDGRPADNRQTTDGQPLADKIRLDKSTQEEIRQEESTLRHLSQTPKGEARAKPEPDPLFAEFWEVYPKKVAKQEAEKVWRKLRVDSALFEAIMQGVERWKQSAQWADTQFVPHPATFLNGKRWEDHVPATAMHGRNGSASSPVFDLDRGEYVYPQQAREPTQQDVYRMLSEVAKAKNEGGSVDERH